MPALTLLSAMLGLAPLTAPPVGCISTQGTPLPLIERPATTGSGPLVLLLTGDGGWANADQKVAEGLVARGSPVIGVNMRAYLGTRRSPDEVARDLACIASAYLTRWQRERVLLLGYSRGADIAPFVAARWDTDLRSRLVLVALISMARRANFQFHLVDLFRDVRRPDDVPLAPEIEKLRGLRVLCVYGRDDETSGCPEADSTVVRRVAREGGHRITGGFDAIAELLSPALSPTGR